MTDKWQNPNNMRSMPYHAVIFDMDGLMINSEQLSFDILCGYYGDSFTLDYYRTLIGISDDETYRLLNAAYPECVFDNDAFQEEYDRRLQNGELHAKPGLFRLLELLKQRGIPVAVASSNILPVIQSCLRVIGLLDTFQIIVCDGMVPLCKPAPDLFLKAAELLGVPPEHCLVLEDSSAGIQAACAARCPVIMIPDLIEPTPEISAKCVSVLPSLDNVADLFSQSMDE